MEGQHPPWDIKVGDIVKISPDGTRRCFSLRILHSYAAEIRSLKGVVRRVSRGLNRYRDGYENVYEIVWFNDDPRFWQREDPTVVRWQWRDLEIISRTAS
jgi:hypothetical protein